MPAEMPLRLQRRHHFSALGRHLHRSVLRQCMAMRDLQVVLYGADAPYENAEASSIEAVARRVADDAHQADMLHRTLDDLHRVALDRFTTAAGEADLLALWAAAVGTPAMAGAYWALLTHPAATRSVRHLAYGDVEMLNPTLPSGPLPMLLGRRSVSPRRLSAPGPDAEHLDLMLQAALSAPDHGRLRPWRVIEFRADARRGLADLFEAEKKRRDPMANDNDIRRARAHATEPPTLLAFVVSLRQRKQVPLREQWLAAGAALGNLLNAAHELGYGAIVLSGDRCFDPQVAAGLGLGADESLAGFVSIGTIAAPPPDTARPLSQTVWSCWSPATMRRTLSSPDAA